MQYQAWWFQVCEYAVSIIIFGGFSVGVTLKAVFRFSKKFLGRSVFRPSPHPENTNPPTEGVIMLEEALEE